MKLKSEEVSTFADLGANFDKVSKSTTERRNGKAIIYGYAKSVMEEQKCTFSNQTKVLQIASSVHRLVRIWKLKTDTARVQAFDNKCHGKLPESHEKRKKQTNEFAIDQIISLSGPQEYLLSVTKRRKLAWFGHVTRHGTLAKTILQE